MAAKKRDFLDEIIDMQENWNALSHTGDDLVEQLTANPEDTPYYDPDDYRERPRVNSITCVTAVSQNPDACARCLDACPIDAIQIRGSSVIIDDACCRCDLCVAVCPVEAFTVNKNAPLAIYDKIARVATAYDQCYITCARAIDRIPKPNEVVLPCVGAIAREVWFDLLCEYPNISVYLPLGICDDCRIVTGELAFSDAIADAEEWSGETVGLEVDEADLVRSQKRAYKRSQFVSNMTQAGTRLVSRTAPALAGAQAVANRMREHSNQINELQRTLERASGAQNAQKRHRMLTRKRRLVMAGLQKYPDLADEMFFAFPEVDFDACTMCEDCVKVCTLHALEMDKSGRVLVEPSYCTNCGACAIVCPEGAISMNRRDAQELVVPDPKAEERQRQRRRAQKIREEGKKKLDKGLSIIEGLAEDADDKSGK